MSPELRAKEQKRKAIIRAMHQVGKNLPDATPLAQIAFGAEKIKRLEEWQKAKKRLSPTQRNQLSTTLNMAVRADINNLRTIRRSSVRALSERTDWVPSQKKERNLGTHRSQLLKGIFDRPKTT